MKRYNESSSRRSFIDNWLVGSLTLMERWNKKVGDEIMVLN